MNNNNSAPPHSSSMMQGNYQIYNNNQPRNFAQVSDYSGGANTQRPNNYSALGIQNTNKGFMPVKPNIMDEFTQSRRDG